MTGTLVVLPRQSPLNGGETVAGAKCFVYDAGGTTKRNTYTTSDLSIANSNPLVADANGRYGAMWVDPSGGDYKIVLAPAGDTDPPSSPFWTDDNIPAAGSQSVPFYERTAAEISAGVTPTNYQYPLGHMFRYGIPTDGTSDCTAALNKAMAVAAQVSDGLRFYFPSIGAVYRFTTKPNNITKGVHIYGDSRNTTFYRDYDGASSDEGLLNFRTTGEYFIVRDLSILSVSGRSGGCLISVVADASNNVAWGLLDNLRLTTTGTDTHDYTVYVDGSPKSSDPVGVRLFTMHNCELFGGALGAAFIKGTMSFLGDGLRTFQAGGTSGKIRISGVLAGVQAYYTHIYGGFIAGIDADHCEQLVVKASRINGDLALASTVIDPDIEGVVTGSITDNATYTNPKMGSMLYARNVRATRIGIGTAPGSFGLESVGLGISARTSGSVTNVGHAGIPFTTVVPAGDTFTFTCGSAKKFTIDTQGGDAADVFATYKSATITIVDPGAHFVNSASPGAAETGIHKSANDHVINITNGTAGPLTYGILVSGNVSVVTDPA